MLLRCHLNQVVDCRDVLFLPHDYDVQFGADCRVVLLYCEHVVEMEGADTLLSREHVVEMEGADTLKWLLTRASRSR